MIKYARRDTHYLLFIYDCLRKDLIDAGKANKNCDEENNVAIEKLKTVWQQSNQVALSTYDKPKKYSRQYTNLLQGQKLVWDDCRMELFTALWEWRTSVAKKEDESEVYIMENKILMQIVNS